jgi:hypothetical protein
VLVTAFAALALIAGSPAVAANAASSTPSTDLGHLPAVISKDSPQYAALVNTPGFHYAPATAENLARISTTAPSAGSSTSQAQSLGLQATPLVTAGNCNFTGRADYPHVTNFEASVHGYWVVLSGTCPSTAKVTVDLQAVGCTPFGCVWITQDTRSGTFTPGSGTGHWATPHKACANANTVGWRGQVDVDLTGVNDPSGYQYSAEVNLECSPA